MNVKILDQAATSVLINSIAKRGVKLDLDIWTASVGSLAHAEQSGDWSLFQRLLNAMPRGSRVTTLVDWAKMFSPVDVQKTQATGFKVKTAKTGTWDIDGAKCSPWWEYKNPTTMVTVDLAALAAMLNKLAESKNSTSRTVTDEVRAMAATLAAEVKMAMAPAEAPKITRKAA